ncbi:MAG: MraY family glycosyltransferase [Dehalococcoidia bacterium]
MGIELAVALVAIGIAAPLTFALRLPTKVGRHIGPVHVPRIGGFAIVTAFIVSPFVVAAFSAEMRELIEHDQRSLLALGFFGFLVFLVGARDDFRDVHWKPKLGIQVGAALGLYVAGFRVGEVTVPVGGTLELGLADPLVTVFWIVLLTNAMNLIDGRDGVAAGIAALVSGTMAYVAYDLNHELIAVLFATLCGASLGFVPFNLPPARRLLGDSGAYFIGFTLGGLTLAGFVDSTGRVPLFIPICALALPIIDVGVAFLRRTLNGRPPFEADTDHFHHRLERQFRLGPLGVALTIYGITAVFCLGALLLHVWYKSVGSAVVGGAVLLFALGLIAALGYIATMWNSVRVSGWRGRPHPAAESNEPLKP